MLLLAFIVAGLAVGFLRRGSLERLASMPFRYSWLILLAFLVQVIVLSATFDSSTLSPYAPWIHLFSYLLLLLAVVINLHFKGMWVLGLGLVLNLIVIAANGGYMPASLDQLAAAGRYARVAQLQANGHASNIRTMTPETRLAFLGDILAVPSSVPLSTTFSVGDVLVGFGGFGLVYEGMTRKDRG